MRMHGFLASAAMLAVLSFSGAASADNLVHNWDFRIPRAGLAPPVTDFTSTTASGLAGYAAADQWLVWTGGLGARVRTRLEPSELYLGGRMLHVWGYEVDQVFGDPHTGPAQGYFCALIKVVSGSVGAGTGDQGRAGPGMTVGPTNTWVRIGGREASPRINQVAIIGNDANAEFYVQSVEVSPTPIPCDRIVDITKFPRPETYVRPDPYPWTMHPEQVGGTPAQGSKPNPDGYFENMAPGGKPVHSGTGGKSTQTNQPPAGQQAPGQKQ